MNLKKTIILLVLMGAFISLIIYYYFPYTPISDNVIVDRIVINKSHHQLFAYSAGKVIKTYKISLGKNPVGAKEYEGDDKTPEGMYTINDKNPNSNFHKSLGISYPNPQDLLKAKQLNKPAGGDIKIHGLGNNQGYFGKFQRWRDWTTGCIALTNQEIDDLYKHTPIGITIEIIK